MDLMYHSLLRVAGFIVLLRLFQVTKQNVGLINSSVIKIIIVLMMLGDVMEMRIVPMAQMREDVVSYCVIVPV